jgi:hypothetical protein
MNPHFKDLCLLVLTYLYSTLPLNVCACVGGWTCDLLLTNRIWQRWIACHFHHYITIFRTLSCWKTCWRVFPTGFEVVSSCHNVSALLIRSI